MLTPHAFKLWYFVHKWTSLVCTAFLLLRLTGLALIFSEEIRLWLGTSTSPANVADTATQANLDHLVDAAKRLRPDENIRLMARNIYKPVWTITTGVSNGPNSPSLQFDARTGELLGSVPAGQDPVRTILKLHSELFVGLPGMLLLGCMGALFLASVVSGVVVYGPFMRKLPFGTVRQEQSRRIIWLDLHNLVGIATVVWVVVVGATGAINAFSKPVFSQWRNASISDMTSTWRDEAMPENLISVQQAVTAAQSIAPDGEIDSIAFPGSFAGKRHFLVVMRGNTALTSRLTMPLLIDAETGALSARRTMPWHLAASRIWVPIHFADYGGIFIKITWALLDICAIVVLISGLYLWLKKRRLPMEQRLFEILETERLIANQINRRTTMS